MVVVASNVLFSFLFYGNLEKARKDEAIGTNLDRSPFYRYFSSHAPVPKLLS